MGNANEVEVIVPSRPGATGDCRPVFEAEVFVCVFCGARCGVCVACVVDGVLKAFIASISELSRTLDLLVELLRINRGLGFLI